MPNNDGREKNIAKRIVVEGYIVEGSMDNPKGHFEYECGELGNSVKYFELNLANNVEHLNDPSVKRYLENKSKRRKARESHRLKTSQEASKGNNR